MSSGSFVNSRPAGSAPLPAIVRGRGKRIPIAEGRISSSGLTLAQSDQPMYYTFTVADGEQKQASVALHPDTLAGLLVSWEYTPEQLAEAYAAAKRKKEAR